MTSLFSLLDVGFILLFLPYVVLSTLPKTRTKVAFGSCSKVEEPQPFWKIISSRKPEVFVWLGDNIYADVRKSDFYKNPNIFSGKGKDSLLPGDRPRFQARTKEEHEKMYNKQKNIPEYVTLASTTKIIGTWDDHDCGINDADKFFDKKDERQALHLDFLNVKNNDPRRKRKGVYTSYVVDRIKIILLDVRYHRDPWPWHPGAKDATESDVLGEEQWQWLEEELTAVDMDNIDLTLIGSGIQVLPVTEIAREKHEAWIHFEKSRGKFISLLSNSKSPIILLSGDVHFAEVSEMICWTSNNNIDEPSRRRLVEFTSSGLTHAWAGPLNWPKPMPSPLIFRSLWYFWHILGIHPWRVVAYPGLNFGEIEVYGKHVELRAIGVDNKTKFQMSIGFEELIGGKNSKKIEKLTHDESNIECIPIHGKPSDTRLFFLETPKQENST
eukprot:g9137.t1